MQKTGLKKSSKVHHFYYSITKKHQSFVNFGAFYPKIHESLGVFGFLRVFWRNLAKVECFLVKVAKSWVVFRGKKLAVLVNLQGPIYHEEHEEKEENEGQRQGKV